MQSFGGGSGYSITGGGGGSVLSGWGADRSPVLGSRERDRGGRADGGAVHSELYTYTEERVYNKMMTCCIMIAQ